MRTLAGEIRNLASILSMDVDADIISNIRGTWDSIRETDLGKKIQTFIERAKNTIRRWLDSRMPGISKAISEGTGGNLILTPSEELMSRDRRIRVKI